MPETPEHRVLTSTDIELAEDGYDTDGQPAPWDSNEIECGNDLIAEESPLPDEMPVGSNEEAVGGNPNPTVTVEVSMLSIEDMMKMKVLELRDELKKRRLNTHGNKAELQGRMKGAIEQGVTPTSTAVTAGTEVGWGDCFDDGAHWELLIPDGEVLNDEGLNVNGVRMRAPTEPENEMREGYATKQNYNAKFDRPVFTGKTKMPKFNSQGQLVTDRDGKVEYEEERPCEETVPNIEWCEANGLDLGSHPAHWFEAFLPIRNGRHGSEHKYTMENALSWTNLKAMMLNGGLGGTYSDFVPFTLVELMKHIALYLFHGLSPSPQVEMKFKSQKDDPVNGNDFIHMAFGSSPWKAIRRHKHFKSFFAAVDPRYPVPNRDRHPNWKVHPFLKHMMKVCQSAMHMGRNLSVDEQTIGFQGHHRDKQRITYKKEGDGFLADTICGDGYTYAFYFRHQPIQSPDYLSSKYKLSPLHLRVEALFSLLKHKNYTVGMDNLYMSAKFCRVAFECEQRVMIHGVVRPSLRGVPGCVKQKEVTRKTDLERVRHTVRVAVLKNDSVCKNLVCISLYDSKPVYLLSNACPEVKWIEKKKKVWSPELNRKVELGFHRLNVIDFYNNNMGNVDIADQLRNYYRYDTQWHRNRKWWWSIWWWGFQLLLTNSYISYVKYHKMHGRDAPLSHYDFIKQVALAWIEPGIYWPGWNTTRRKTRRSQSADDSACTSVSSESIVGRRIRTRSVKSEPQRKRRRMTDNALNPLRGCMKDRLNKSLVHNPINISKEGKRGKCQLHRWARGNDGKEVRQNILKCSVCEVHLCCDCWAIFHNTHDITSEKANIAK